MRTIEIKWNGDVRAWQVTEKDSELERSVCVGEDTVQRSALQRAQELAESKFGLDQQFSKIVHFKRMDPTKVKREFDWPRVRSAEGHVSL